MTEGDELVTVYRTADPDAEAQANAALETLCEAGLSAEVFDDSAPGVPEGAFEVRVPAWQAGAAERVIAGQQDFRAETVDTSHDLDMVAVFVSDAHNAEMLATGVRSVLEAQGIPSVLVGGSQLPSLPFEVRVPQARLEEARQALVAAEQAGPAAAEEAERELEILGELE